MNSKIGINDKSLWNDASIEETIKRMDPDQLYRYQKMAQILYDKTANDPNPHTNNMEVAAQVKLMLRDGLYPDMLEENERQIYIDAYGLKSLEEYTKDDNRSDDQGVDSYQDPDQGVPRGNKWTTKSGKTVDKRDPKLPKRTKRKGNPSRRHHVHHAVESREENQPQQEGT
jgi:hypothetical protein